MCSIPDEISPCVSVYYLAPQLLLLSTGNSDFAERQRADGNNAMASWICNKLTTGDLDVQTLLIYAHSWHARLFISTPAAWAPHMHLFISGLSLYVTVITNQERGYIHYACHVPIEFHLHATCRTHLGCVH